MVQIAAKDFHKNMDQYLSKVYKRREAPTGKKKRKMVEVELSEEEITRVDDAKVHVFRREPGWFDRLFRRREEDLHELDEDLTPEELAKLQRMERQIEQAQQKTEQMDETVADEYRESLMTRFFKYLRGARHGEEEDYDELPEENEPPRPAIPDDVKEAFKILNKWLKKLSKRNLDAFKKSDDYARYKEILEKHELVKRK